MDKRKLRTIIILMSIVLVSGCCLCLAFCLSKRTVQRAEQELALLQLLPSSTTAFWSLHSVPEIQEFFMRLYPVDSKLSFVETHSFETLDELPLCLISLSEPSNLSEALFLLPRTTRSSQFMNSFLKQATVDIPPKEFRYREQSLLIYPLQDGQFLTYGLIDDVHVWSLGKYRVEEAIDASLDGHSLAQTSLSSLYLNQRDSLAGATFSVSSTSYLLGRNAVCDSTLCNHQDWLFFNFYVNPSELIAKASLLGDRISYSREELLSTYEFPAETFAYKRWSIQDIESAYMYALRDTIQTPKETVCNRLFYDYITSIGAQDLINMRVRDTVISSDILLSLPLPETKTAQKQLKKLYRKERRPIRSLLRDEGIYFINDVVIPYPAPLFLNLLADVSRDKRVLYLHFLDSCLLLSWNEDLINRYLEQLAKKEDIQSYLGPYFSKEEDSYLSFLADLGVVAEDTRRNYEDLPTLLLQQADYFKEFFVSKTYTPAKSHTVLSLRLEKK